jgi:hypothetical protein
MEMDWRHQYSDHERAKLLQSMIAECEANVDEGNREQVRKLVIHYEDSAYGLATTETEYKDRLWRLVETARGGELRAKLQDLHIKRASLQQQQQHNVPANLHKQATHQWVQEHSNNAVCRCDSLMYRYTIGANGSSSAPAMLVLALHASTQS